MVSTANGQPPDSGRDIFSTGLQQEGVITDRLVDGEAQIRYDIEAQEGTDAAQAYPWYQGLNLRWPLFSPQSLIYINSHS